MVRKEPEAGSVQDHRAPHRALGLLELSIGDPEAALTQFEHALAARRAQGIEEPCLFYFLPDAIEALNSRAPSR